MKILWVCNSVPYRVAAVLGMNKSNKEGWIDGALGRLEESDMLKDDEAEERFRLALACPAPDRPDLSGTYLCKCADLSNGSRVTVYEFHEDITHPERYDDKEENSIEGIIKDYSPDIVHVFGTEYGHTLAVGRTVKKLRDKGSTLKLIIGIQGVISECALKYADGVPNDVIKSETFRDYIKKDNIERQRQKFTKRGEYELEAITYATDIIGRTDFDKEWSHKHNPSAAYHLLNETLRSEFYSGTWDVTSCDRHVIFMSQGDYPLKGLHNILKIMPEIRKKYPDARLVVAGMDLTRTDGIKNMLKLSSYGRYLKRLLEEGNLYDCVEFTGPLDAREMKERYLSCHTYICASSIENSPNSMGEAMILSVPVIASKTGGIPSMIEDETEGLLFDDAGRIPDLIDKIWSDDGYATELGAAAMNRALITHDAKNNMNRLLEIYEELS